MVETFFGFREKPFALTPDPHFFYLSEDHVEALEHLVYGIGEGEGFLVLCGAIGTGKTTLSRVLVQKLDGRVVHSLVMNPFDSYGELLRAVITDFGLVPAGETQAELVRQLGRFLLEEVGPSGRTALIIIDEAQNLADDVLEQLRLLSNIETAKEKLLQILLLGQEELLLKLSRKHLRQLYQRISVKYFLTPLRRGEVGRYLQHRLRVACPQRSLRFTWSAVWEIHRFSGGVPRLINMIANRCLIAAYIRETTTIDRAIVRRARLSLFGEKPALIRRLEKRGRASGEGLPSAEIRRMEEG